MLVLMDGNKRTRMTLNLIDTPEFHALIDRELAAAASVLSPWLPGVRSFLRRHLLGPNHATRTRPSSLDPEWVRTRFAQGELLHRLGKQGLRRAALDVGQMVDLLVEIASVAREPGHPFGPEAAALLRSLSHVRRPANGANALVIAQINAFPRRARTALLRARRHQPICAPETIRAGSLTGTRCTTMNEVLNLGSEARNCLASPLQRHLGIQAGEEEIWALRSPERLVAVLAIRLEPRRLVELSGPDNKTGVSGHGADLADWCRAAGVMVSRRCQIRLADILPPQMTLPEAFEDPDDFEDGWEEWLEAY